MVNSRVNCKNIFSNTYLNVSQSYSMAATHQKVKSSRTFHRPLNSFHWPFINVKQFMSIFDLAFFAGNWYFPLHFKRFSVFTWILWARNLTSLTDSLTFSMTLTTWNNFSDLLRNWLSFPWPWLFFSDQGENWNHILRIASRSAVLHQLSYKDTCKNFTSRQMIISDDKVQCWLCGNGNR